MVVRWPSPPRYGTWTPIDRLCALLESRAISAVARGLLTPAEKSTFLSKLPDIHTAYSKGKLTEAEARTLIQTAAEECSGEIWGDEPEASYSRDGSNVKDGVEGKGKGRDDGGGDGQLKGIWEASQRRLALVAEEKRLKDLGWKKRLLTLEGRRRVKDDRTEEEKEEWEKGGWVERLKRDWAKKDPGLPTMPKSFEKGWDELTQYQLAMLEEEKRKKKEEKMKMNPEKTKKEEEKRKRQEEKRKKEEEKFWRG